MYKTSSAILLPAREIYFDAIHRFKGIVQQTSGPSDNDVARDFTVFL